MADASAVVVSCDSPSRVAQSRQTAAAEKKPIRKFIDRWVGSAGRRAWRYNRRFYWSDVDKTDVDKTASILIADDVWESIRDILVDILGVIREDVRPESRLVEDLGMA